MIINVVLILQLSPEKIELRRIRKFSVQNNLVGKFLIILFLGDFQAPLIDAHMRRRPQK